MTCWPGHIDSSTVSPCFNFIPLSKSVKPGHSELEQLISRLDLPKYGLVGNKYIKAQITGVKCQCHEDLCNHPYGGEPTTLSPSSEGSTEGNSSLMSIKYTLH